ncbi:MAG: methylenetetrahydrofolate reductase [Pseudomonadota bacterium]
MSNTSNPLAEQLKSGKFVLTGEIVPPVSGGSEELLAAAAPFKERLAALNVTDGPGARVHMSSLAASGILAQHGYTPILQMTCRDRNRIAIQADLLGGSAMGVKNVLYLTGDDPTAGDQPEAKAVFDAKSHELLAWSKTMTEDAQLPSGRAISTAPQFFNGAADVPRIPEPDWEPKDLMRKAESGAHFIQTQLCYDIDIAKAYAACLKEHGLTERLYILLGTGPIGSAKSARWMNENLFGVKVPDAVIDKLENAADPKAEGRKLCLEFVAQLREVDGIHGVHLMAPGNIGSLPEVIDQISAQ